MTTQLTLRRESPESPATEPRTEAGLGSPRAGSPSTLELPVDAHPPGPAFTRVAAESGAGGEAERPPPLHLAPAAVLPPNGGEVSGQRQPRAGGGTVRMPILGVAASVPSEGKPTDAPSGAAPPDKCGGTTSSGAGEHSVPLDAIASPSATAGPTATGASSPPLTPAESRQAGATATAGEHAASATSRDELVRDRRREEASSAPAVTLPARTRSPSNAVCHGQRPGQQVRPPVWRRSRRAAAGSIPRGRAGAASSLPARRICN